MRFAARLFVVVFALILLFPAPADAVQPHGLSWIVEDGSSGAVLGEHDADIPRPPASLAKMITALVVVEHMHLDDFVTISSRAAHAEADRLAWPLGMTFTVDQVLHGMLLESSNGAAIALAERISGSQPAFAVLMNEKARQIGAANSHFVTPNGLDAPGQGSTARDLALIARTLLRDETLARIVHTASYDVPWLGGPATFHNSNRFLASYPGSIGVKPGFTQKAGNCLAAAATRGDRTLVAVVLNSTTVTEDATQLINEAFAKLNLTQAPVGETGVSPSPVASQIDEEPAPTTGYAMTTQASGEPVKIADSRRPSIGGTFIVLTVCGIVFRRRRMLRT
ncbi:MAG: D-alanyl-D-alanine carboxypeptidase family protein [Actinomycetota bacterium]|nr:D-alanyl-D-alanine carboxypeptidase [Actinomycetota bacterium]